MTDTRDRTTYRKLDSRASATLETLPGDDPVVRANVLIDRAVVLQDVGDFDGANVLLAEADALLDAA